MSSRSFGRENVLRCSYLAAGDVTDRASNVPTGCDRGRERATRSGACRGPAVASGATRMQAQTDGMQGSQVHPRRRAPARTDSAPSNIGTLPVAGPGPEPPATPALVGPGL